MGCSIRNFEGIRSRDQREMFANVAYQSKYLFRQGGLLSYQLEGEFVIVEEIVS